MNHSSTMTARRAMRPPKKAPTTVPVLDADVDNGGAFPQDAFRKPADGAAMEDDSGDEVIADEELAIVATATVVGKLVTPAGSGVVTIGAEEAAANEDGAIVETTHVEPTSA